MKRFRKSVASASGRPPVVPAQASADRSSSQDGDSGLSWQTCSSRPRMCLRVRPARPVAPARRFQSFCASCGAPLAASDHLPVAAGRSGLNPTAVPSRVLQCKGCGAEVATSLDQRSYQCPFCDAAYVIELPPTEQRQRPEFIIGFAVSADQAKQKFHEWLGQNSWLRPGDLARQSFAEKQRGVYLPFWHFSMFARSRWAAQIGEYWYRTETYVTRDAQGRTQTRTRQVQETEWFPLQGEHQRYYFGFLVPPRAVVLEEARAVQPFQLSALVRYRPFYLAAGCPRSIRWISNRPLLRPGPSLSIVSSGKLAASCPEIPSRPAGGHPHRNERQRSDSIAGACTDLPLSPARIPLPGQWPNGQGGGLETLVDSADCRLGYADLAAAGGAGWRGDPDDEPAVSDGIGARWRNHYGAAQQAADARDQAGSFMAVFGCHRVAGGRCR